MGGNSRAARLHQRQCRGRACAISNSAPGTAARVHTAVNGEPTTRFIAIILRYKIGRLLCATSLPFACSARARTPKQFIQLRCRPSIQTKSLTRPGNVPASTSTWRTRQPTATMVWFGSTRALAITANVRSVSNKNPTGLGSSQPALTPSVIEAHPSPHPRFEA